MTVQGLGAVFRLIELMEELERSRGQNRGQSQGLEDLIAIARDTKPAKAKRKVSAYHRKYKKAFKKVAPKYKKKAGGWKKNGFKQAAAAARKIAKK